VLVADADQAGRAVAVGAKALVACVHVWRRGSRRQGTDVLSVADQSVIIDCLEGNALVLLRVLSEALAVLDVGCEAALAVTVGVPAGRAEDVDPKTSLTIVEGTVARVLWSPAEGVGSSCCR